MTAMTAAEAHEAMLERRKRLVNDHDPRPLRYQFGARYPGEYAWDYLEAGPELWRVRIGRAGA